MTCRCGKSKLQSVEQQMQRYVGRDAVFCHKVELRCLLTMLAIIVGKVEFVTLNKGCPGCRVFPIGAKDR